MPSYSFPRQPSGNWLLVRIAWCSGFETSIKQIPTTEPSKCAARQAIFSPPWGNWGRPLNANIPDPLDVLFIKLV